MDILLKIMGGALGLLVPGLFLYVVHEGIGRAPLPASTKATAKLALHGLVGGFTVVVWALSLAGVLAYHDGDAFPRVFIPLAIPVIVGSALLLSGTYRTILDHVPLPALIAAQAFRFAGIAFLWVVSLGILPGAFAGGGYGDAATATLAIVAALLFARGRTESARVVFWGFTLAGLCDLLNVAYLILRFHPTWYAGTPTSAPMAEFALVMIPAIAAPLALLLHLYSIRSVVLLERSCPLDARAAHAT